MLAGGAASIREYNSIRDNHRIHRQINRQKVGCLYGQVDLVLTRTVGL